MDQEEIRNMTKEICIKYDYPIPEIQFSNRMCITNGLCYQSAKLIKLNSKFCDLASKEDMENLLKHEIVHLKIHGHGHEFKIACKNMGITGEFNKPHSYSKTGQMLNDSAPYWYQCPECKIISKYFRPRRIEYSCGKCDPDKFNEKYLLKRIR